MRADRNLSRRSFLTASTTLAAATIVPRHVLGGPGRVPPSEQLNVAVIGTGGQGITNIMNLHQHRDVKISAICDPARFWDNTEIGDEPVRPPAQLYRFLETFRQGAPTPRVNPTGARDG